MFFFTESYALLAGVLLLLVWQRSLKFDKLILTLFTAYRLLHCLDYLYDLVSPFVTLSWAAARGHHKRKF